MILLLMNTLTLPLLLSACWLAKKGDEAKIAEIAPPKFFYHKSESFLRDW